MGMVDYTAVVVAIIGTGVLNTIVSHILNVTTLKKKDKEEVQTSLRLLMKDRLRFLCTFYINQGWIYEDELEDIIVMHACYHNDLGGNGYLDALMARVKTLEIRGVGVK